MSLHRKPPIIVQLCILNTAHHHQIEYKKIRILGTASTGNNIPVDYMIYFHISFSQWMIYDFAKNTRREEYSTRRSLVYRITRIIGHTNPIRWFGIHYFHILSIIESGGNIVG